MNLLGIEKNSVKQINGNDSLLIDLYRKAEAFVFPSLDEGFGIPIIESFINKCLAGWKNSNLYATIW